MCREGDMECWGQRLVLTPVWTWFSAVHLLLLGHAPLHKHSLKSMPGELGTASFLEVSEIVLNYSYGSKVPTAYFFYSKINTLAVVLEGSYASITYGRFHIEGTECSV